MPWSYVVTFSPLQDNNETSLECECPEDCVKLTYSFSEKEWPLDAKKFCRRGSRIFASAFERLRWSKPLYRRADTQFQSLIQCCPSKTRTKRQSFFIKKCPCVILPLYSRMTQRLSQSETFPGNIPLTSHPATDDVVLFCREALVKDMAVVSVK